MVVSELIPPRLVETQRRSEVLISAEQIQARTKELAAKISEDYAGKEPVVIIVLKGAAFFGTLLLTQLEVEKLGRVDLDFFEGHSYKGQKSTGQLTVVKDVTCPVMGRDVIVVEDIVDSGFTCSWLCSHLAELGANSVEICSLLVKPARNTTGLNPRYFGFEIPDVWVFGVGLDNGGVEAGDESRFPPDINYFT